MEVRLLSDLYTQPRATLVVWTRLVNITSDIWNLTPHPLLLTTCQSTCQSSHQSLSKLCCSLSLCPPFSPICCLSLTSQGLKKKQMGRFSLLSIFTYFLFFLFNFSLTFSIFNMNILQFLLPFQSLTHLSHLPLYTTSFPPALISFFPYIFLYLFLYFQWRQVEKCKWKKNRPWV